MKEDLEIHNFYSEYPIPERLLGFVLNSSNKPISNIIKLSKINLFVGSNNSGKSLLLREMLKTTKIENTPSELIKATINKERNNIISKVREYLEENEFVSIRNSQGYVINEDILQSINLDFTSDIKTVTDYRTLFLKTKYNRVHQKAMTYTPLGKYQVYKKLSEDQKSQIQAIQNEIIQWFESLNSHYINNQQLIRIYSPTIRSLRKYSSTALIDKTKSEYNFDDDIKIENGQLLYSTIAKMTSSVEAIRQKKKDFEAFIGQEFFDNKRIELTANPDAGELLIKIGNEKERPIYDIGEGIQMLIILTFPIFYYDNGIYTIEEPEIFLHPGYQHKLMKTFHTHPKSSNFIFYISTHSNHILDATNYNDNISVYSMSKVLESNESLSKEAYFILSQLSGQNNSLLHQLGVRNTSVFLSNCTIWVEGITDMLYLRKYLELYLQNLTEVDELAEAKFYQEGIHYSFILSGGSSIIHYDFSDEPSLQSLKEKVVTRNICGKAFVIVDNDGGKHKSRKKKFFEELDGRFSVLPVIEIENLLSNEAIEKTIKLFPSCARVEINKEYFKKEKAYSTIRLGSYIDNYLLKDYKKGIKKYSQEKTSTNSTLNCKLEFCKKAITQIEVQNMTNASKKITKEIIEFITKKNKSYR